MDRTDALSLLARVPVIHLATTTPDGAPVLRTLHAAVVDDAWRKRGVGEALMRLLLAHPAVRGARCVRLGTRDAQA